MSITLINLLRNKEITKSGYLFLEALYHESQKLALTVSGYFYRYDSDFISKGILSLPTLRKIRMALKEKRIIDFYELSDRKNIAYKLLISI